jgi:hypothetical protein
MRFFTALLVTSAILETSAMAIDILPIATYKVEDQTVTEIRVAYLPECSRQKTATVEVNTRKEIVIVTCGQSVTHHDVSIDRYDPADVLVVTTSAAMQIVVTPAKGTVCEKLPITGTVTCTRS